MPPNPFNPESCRRYGEIVAKVRDSLDPVSCKIKLESAERNWNSKWVWDDEVYTQEFEGAVRSFLNWVPEGAEKWLTNHAHFFVDPDDVLHCRGLRDVPVVRVVDYPRGGRSIFIDEKRLREMLNRLMRD